MILKIFALIYPIIIILLVSLFFRFFHIRSFSKFRVPDLATFFIIFGIRFFSLKFTQMSALPYFLIIISIVGLIILFNQLFRLRRFDLGSFIKLFWRLTFFIALAFFYAMVIISFIK
ncbi:DUF3397 family protein [Floricoccus penangensis]|uniref:DUF3397 family protein n=1 Tax=Floricoccus penangensis TaxID=1859475 RepID=UPI002189FCE7|nr:DUF3397 family protein [Floricoccus penangensis]